VESLPPVSLSKSSFLVLFLPPALMLSSRS
jgi:hypothetical protein